MKKRIQIDTLLLFVAVLLTVGLYQFPGLFINSFISDDILFFIGVIFVFKGVWMRMAARGYKKHHSQSGGNLVTGGPYRFVRNPMYLGSFTTGVGFVLIAWPWWSIPVFAILFYLRFKRQIAKEEKLLTKLFGPEYEQYRKNVPPLFPKLKDLVGARTIDLFCFPYAFTTKEKRGLFIFPIAALVLETLQQKFILHHVDWLKMLVYFFAAVGAFGVIVAVEYFRSKRL